MRWKLGSLLLACSVSDAVFVPDPMVQAQWGVAAIGAPTLWQLGLIGSRSVRVCLLDTGVDLTNADLSPNVWNATDGSHGVNIVFDPPTKDVQDDNGHGTMVAGIVGAANNGAGVVGVAPLVTLLPCKFLGAAGEGDMSRVQGCLAFCRDRDAQLVHGSFGETQDFPDVRAAIAAMEKNGTLFVFSAGNDGMDTDRCAFFLKSGD